MKTKLILSVLSALTYYMARGFYSTIYSPVTGVATAQALSSDSVASYATAKLLREGTVESLFVFSLLIALVVIWYPRTSSKS